MRKFTFAGVLLLVLTNAVVLAGVAYNRAGTPVSTIELTERELPIWYSYSTADENSGMALDIAWEQLDLDEDPEYLSKAGIKPVWPDDAKLVELGFEIDKLESDRERYQNRIYDLEQEVILVLEYDGVAYHQALQIAENKAARLRSEAEINPDDTKLADEREAFEKRLIRMKQAQSRLYVIDGGRDRQALMNAYAGQDNIMFVKGRIGLIWNDDEIEGRLQRLSIEQIHVPLPFSKLLSEFTVKQERYDSYGTREQAPRYKVQLNIGKRLEPWIESVTLMN